MPSRIEAENFVMLAVVTDLTKVITDSPIGTMITAVAVLLTHAEMNPEATISPKTIWLGRVPKSRMVANAIRWCRFHRCTPSPSGTAAQDQEHDRIRIRCNRLPDRRHPQEREQDQPTGSSEATAAGTASVIHQGRHKGASRCDRTRLDSQRIRKQEEDRRVPIGPTPTAAIRFKGVLLVELGS